MQIVRLTISLGFVAFAGYFAWLTYSNYRTAVGTTWQRLLSSARDSATILWSRFSIVVAALVANLDTLADLFNAPEAKTFIDTWVGNPKVVAGVMLAISLVTITARRRTL